MSIKGYELMRLAKESPDKYEGKRYKVVKGIVFNKNGGCFYEVVVYNGEIVIAANKNHSALINASTELEEIKQPVTPQEAAKAYLERKTISCIIDNGHKYVFGLSCAASLGYVFTEALMQILLNGTWHIEE